LHFLQTPVFDHFEDKRSMVSIRFLVKGRSESGQEREKEKRKKEKKKKGRRRRAALELLRRPLFFSLLCLLLLFILVRLSCRYTIHHKPRNRSREGRRDSFACFFCSISAYRTTSIL
jgi:hypothetical protein